MLVWDNRKYHWKIGHTVSFMPLLIINDSVTTFGMYASRFQTLYNNMAGYLLLTDAETVDLQWLEMHSGLNGTPISYSDPDGKAHHGTIKSQDSAWDMWSVLKMTM